MSPFDTVGGVIGMVNYFRVRKVHGIFEIFGKHVSTTRQPQKIFDPPPIKKKFLLNLKTFNDTLYIILSIYLQRCNPYILGS